jgi:hypothetical protein
LQLSGPRVSASCIPGHHKPTNIVRQCGSSKTLRSAGVINLALVQ